jgi:hypothetical protein
MSDKCFAVGGICVPQFSGSSCQMARTGPPGTSNQRYQPRPGTWVRGRTISPPCSSMSASASVRSSTRT